MEQNKKRQSFDNLPSEVSLIRDDLSKLHEDVNKIGKYIKSKTQTIYLTREEVAELLKCDISTVHNWTKKGKLFKYGLGHRAYYKLHEVELAIKPIN